MPNYMENGLSTIPSEEELLSIAGRMCQVSPRNILLLGGGMIFPSIIGFKKLRLRSKDLDFVVNDRGLADLNNSVDLSRDFYENLGCFHFYEGDVLLAFFHSNVRGYDIPREVYVNPFVGKDKDIFTVPPEMNIALKIRRGSMKHHVYGKDAQDFASTILGLRGNGGFDYNLWKECMIHGVCSSCKLPKGEFCMDTLEMGVKNLRTRYVPDFLEAVKNCGDLASDFCENY